MLFFKKNNYEKYNTKSKFRNARIWSNKELLKFSSLFNGKIINVSAGDNIDKEGRTYDDYFNNADEFWISNYAPGSYRGYKNRNNELLIDLEKKIDKGLINSFDVVFNHTTLEHIFYIFDAFKNLSLLTKDILIIVVPFLQEQHDVDGYNDYWRFSPKSLHRLFEINKITILYESINNDFNSANYIFIIGSKKPEKWKMQFPKYSSIKNAGKWIGKIK